MLGGLFSGVDLGCAAVYPSPTMNELLVQRPIDAWAATISKQNG